MDIRCPDCSTLYEFDANRIRGRSVNFKCSQCGAVFKVVGPPAEEGDGRNRNRWMVKKVDTGDILYFTGMQTLQKWIIDREVSQADTISKTGNKWKELGDIGELSSFFQVAESIERVQPGSQPTKKPVGGAPVSIGGAAAPEQTAETRIPPPRPEPAPKPAPVSIDNAPTIQAPQAQAPPQHTPRPAPQPTPKPPPQTLTRPPQDSVETGPWGKVKSGQMETGGWSIGGGAPAPAESTYDYDEASQESSSKLPMILVIVLVLILGAGVTLYFVAPELLGLAPKGDAKVAVATADAGTSKPDTATATPDAGADTASADVGADTAEADVVEDKVAAKADGKTAARRRSAARGGRDDGDDGGAMSGSFDGLMRKGYRYLRSGNGSKAQAAFKGAVAKNPGNSEAHSGLGWAYLSGGNAGAAVGAFKKALAINSRYGDAYIGLGQAYRSTGQKAQALAAYERYLNYYPSGSKASIAKAQSERLKEQLEPKKPPTDQPPGGGTPVNPGGTPNPNPGGTPAPGGAPAGGGTPAPAPGGGSPAPAPGGAPAPAGEAPTPAPTGG